jgi:APA family basic amino acid/polyamine antiporter
LPTETGRRGSQPDEASIAGTPALGLWPSTALVVGHTIGVGIFLTPAEVIGAVASPLLTLGLWVACGALVQAGALTFGELASRYPKAGGPYLYLREAWGDRIAFLYGWQSVLVLDPGVTAALALGMADYAVLLWPAVAGAERWLAIATIWTVAAVSMSGVTLSARVLGFSTALKLAAFAVVVLLAFTSGAGSWSHFIPLAGRQPGGAPLIEAMALSLVGVFFSFGGFWEASRMAGEVRDPARTLPSALVLGVSCVTVVYVATTMAFIYLVPVERATSATELARHAGEALLGHAGPTMLAAIVVLSAVVSLLALVIMAPRLYPAMSRDGLFPSALATVNPATQSPVRATALVAVLASAFVLAGTFRQIVAFFMCTMLTFIALAGAGLIVVRRRAPSVPPFAAPAYPLTVVLFVLLTMSVVVLIGIGRPVQALGGLAIVLMGVPAHRALAARRGRTARA